MNLEALESKIATDKWGCFTILALLSTIGMLINSIILSSSTFGILFSAIYFTISSIFMGRLFFKDESFSFRVAFGFLSLLIFTAAGGAILMLLNTFEVFPMRFDIRVIVAILSSTMIMVSLVNHLQMRFAKSKQK